MSNNSNRPMILHPMIFGVERLGTKFFFFPFSVSFPPFPISEREKFRRKGKRGGRTDDQEPLLSLLKNYVNGTSACKKTIKKCFSLSLCIPAANASSQGWRRNGRMSEFNSSHF